MGTYFKFLLLGILAVSLSLPPTYADQASEARVSNKKDLKFDPEKPRRCRAFFERLGYFTIHPRAHLWEGDIRFFNFEHFDPGRAHARQIRRFKFFIRKHSEHQLPLRKAILSQIARFQRMAMNENNPFAEAAAPRLIGRPNDEITFADLRDYFAKNQESIQFTISRGKHLRLPPVWKWGAIVGGTLTVILSAGTLYGYASSLSGAVFSAASEIHASIIRLQSFQVAFGDPKFVNALDRLAFEQYHRMANGYTKDMNKTKGFWEQYGFDRPQFVGLMISQARSALQTNRATDNFDFVEKTEVLRLYQLFFAYPEYVHSDAAEEISQTEAMIRFLEAYDPDQKYLKLLLNRWQTEYGGIDAQSGLELFEEIADQHR